MSRASGSAGIANMTNRTFSVVLLGLMTYLVGLIPYLPAERVSTWLLPQSVQLRGVEGSVWSGRAHTLAIGGVPVRNVGWHWNFLPLFMGRVELVFASDDTAFDIAGTATWGLLTEQLELTGVTGVVTAEFGPLRDLYPLQAAGRADVHLQRLTWRRQQQLQIDGRIDLAEIALGVGDRVRLGTVDLQFEPNTNGSRATIRGQGADLAVQGGIEIDPDASYRLTLQITPVGVARAEVAAQLGLLGLSATRGGEWQYAGRLPIAEPAVAADVQQ